MRDISKYIINKNWRELAAIIEIELRAERMNVASLSNILDGIFDEAFEQGYIEAERDGHLF